MKKVLLFLGFFALALPIIIASAQDNRSPIISVENIQGLSIDETLLRGRAEDAIWTPDGRTLIIAGATGLWLYDADNYEAEPRFLQTSNGWIRSLAISPSGQVATGHQNGAVTIWDIQTGRETHTLNGHIWPVLSLDFSPDGSQVATASGFSDCTGVGKRAWDNHINIWDAGSGALLESILPREVGIYEVAFSADGKFLGTASNFGCGAHEYNALIRIFDLQTGEPIDIPNPYEDRFEAPSRNDRIEFTPDGRWWITTGHNGVLVWNRAENRVEARTGDLGYRDLALTPDGERISIITRCLDSESYDYCVGFLDTNTWQLSDYFPIGGLSENIGIHPNGEEVITIDWYQGIHIWDATSGEELYGIDAFGRAPYSLSFTPNGESLSYVQNGQLMLRDTQTLEVWPIATELPAEAFVFSPDSRFFAYEHSGSSELVNKPQHIYLHDLKSGEQLWRVDGTASQLVFSADGTQLFAVHEESGLRILDVQTGTTIQEPRLEQPLWEATLNTDGTLIAGVIDNAIHLYDPISGTAVATLPGEITHDPQFSPDGRDVVGYAGQHNFPNSLMVWEVESGDVLLESGELRPSTADLVFSPDSRLLVHGGDTYLTFVDTQTWEIVAALPTSSPFTELAFSEDGRLIASATLDGTLQIWRITP